MTWGPAQAGNRASKTGRYLQWWDNEPEYNAVISAGCKVHHYIFSLLSLIAVFLSCATAAAPISTNMSAGNATAYHKGYCL